MTGNAVRAIVRPTEDDDRVTHGALGAAADVAVSGDSRR